MKIKNIIFLFIIAQSMNIMSNECKVVFHLNNADSSYFAYFINDNKIIFADTQAVSKDSFSLSLLEPTSIFMIIENDTSRMLNFFVYPGRLELFIDASNPRASVFVNSALNQEYIDYKRRRDSISNMVYTSKILSIFNNLSFYDKDSINKIYNNHIIHLNQEIYKEGFKKTSSFLILQYIESWLESTIRDGRAAMFSKKQLKTLFDKLDKNMCTYPTYQRCKTLFSLKSKKLPKINSPLIRQ